MTTSRFNIQTDADRCMLLEREWLLTNGSGGFAMGSLLGPATRRYHAWLIASIHPPVDRVVTLHSALEELVLPDCRHYPLSTHAFADERGESDTLLHPRGDEWLHLIELVANHSISWHWNIHNTMQCTRTLMLSHTDAQQCTVTYDLQGLPPGTLLRVHPFLAMRDFHELRTAGHSPIEIIQVDTHTISAASAMCAIHLSSTATWQDDPDMWRRFAYKHDNGRGQDWVEDLFVPGCFVATADAAGVCTLALTASLAGASSKSAATSAHARALDELSSAAEQFIVTRGADASRSILAGYPWFADWGRDSMISLPGLLLVDGRFDEAESVLLTFARRMRRGLIPNRFDDRRSIAHYNAADASLWFVHAVHALYRCRSSTSHPELLNACMQVIAAYRHGTDYKIGICADGLITAGDETTQLTWMDAARDGIVFTPRHGKAVEVNALWHHALCCLAEMCDYSDEDRAAELRELAGFVSLSFQMNFWWSEHNCLHDVLAPNTHVADAEAAAAHSFQIHQPASASAEPYIPDDRLRPNQIFAAAVEYSPLTLKQRMCVIDIVRERLLTPVGLRTLDRDDPDYQPRYEGRLFERDQAYHNGAVWPWLIGPYCEAVLRAGNFDATSQAIALDALDTLRDATDATGPYGACADQICEIYDGDAPHRPSGCVAQAWSVAEVRRILWLVNNPPSSLRK
ncbi:MAG: amylo-alpha-1,6-glucosidase [Phycisphaerales bacterium]